MSASQHLAMRRNIEKLVADKLGAEQAQAVLPKLAEPKPQDDSIRELREEIASLLGHVMGAHEVDTWLEDLTAGRFNIPAAGDQYYEMHAPPSQDEQASGKLV